jgi:hypothetical protein
VNLRSKNGINKNFVVKNGLEVGGGLIYADYDNLVVGVGTTAVDYNFHVIGGIGATDLKSYWIYDHKITYSRK